MQLTHRVDFSRGPVATHPAYVRHMDELLQRHGSVRIVNLLGDKPGESALSVEYRRHMAAMNDQRVHWTSFDVHTMCKNHNYENLRILFADLSRDMKAYAYFHKDRATNAVRSTQAGVFRTNCLDCLDRYVGPSYHPCT